MAYSYDTYFGNGTNKVWSVTFGYIKKAHVQVLVDGVSVSFSWLTDTSIETTVAAPMSAEVVIKRVTPKDPMVSYSNGAIVKAADLNLANLQAIYLAQEAADQTRGEQGPPGPPGSGGSGGASSITYPAGIILSGQRVVLYAPGVGWIYADSSIVAHGQAQVAVTKTAANLGVDCEAVTSGVMDEPSWSWPAPCVLFLGTSGQLTITPPTSGFVREIARAVSATRIVIEPEQAINLL
jgi:hypothetical protein